MQPMNNPQYYLQQQQRPQGEMFVVSVAGEIGAMSYPVGAGNTAFAVDWNEKTFWVKTTDINGVPQPMRKFKFEEIIPEPQQVQGGAVSRAEFEEVQSSLNKIMAMLQTNKKEGEAK